ncbi:APC family permease [Kiritimatiellaeota bacterium B1221]|nr:APC family permease [Kiritimatiellaeota bacterium B1221]
MPSSTLKRTLGLPGALFMGLGSMVGTGVFVSIGLAAGVAGTTVLPAIALAAVVALCNGMSSAQLAAAHPVSGGTYEYGYKFIGPEWGFSAGWMFLLAKSASAATAALGFGGYLLHLIGWDERIPLVAPALLLILLMTLLVQSGLRRSNWINTFVVSLTLLSLILFVFTVIPAYVVPENLQFTKAPFKSSGFLKGCALMFVAYTGYGRICTMGEEIRNPRKNIPKAILAVVMVTSILYILVAMAAIGAVSADEFGKITRGGAAPLEIILSSIGKPQIASIVTVGALTAMFGVLLNLILGLSRVLLAMGRRGDMPRMFARVQNDSPKTAVYGVAVLIALIALPGKVHLAWAFSAFTVLVYYSITNLAALRLPAEDRIYPRIFSWIGLLSCLFLAFQVGLYYCLVGATVLVIGLFWHKARRKK